ncbi:MAG: alpha-2-macroglobulin, partial [Deltaproteobacteria bacterium]|nr:alpha-2-macroglobulin [Deltaproteobacteria bacterium]
VDAGVADIFGQKAGLFSGEVKLDDLEPSFGLGARLALLEAGGRGMLPARSVNCRQGRAEVWALTPAELAQQLAFRPWEPRRSEPMPPRPPTVLELDLDGRRNVTRYTPLPLRQALPPGQRTGFFLVKAWSAQTGERPQDRERVLAQLTDLAVHAKLGAASGVLWVTSLAQGKPVAGARLELLDRRGLVRWSGTSDAGGLARTPGLAELLPGEDDGWTAPFALAVASKGGDSGATLSTWTGPYWPGDFDLDADWDGTTPRSLGLVFTDRGVYRPGEEVHFSGLTRFRRLGRIRRPDPGTMVTVTVTDSREKQVSRQTMRLSEFGTFRGRFTLGGEAPLGFYTVAAEAAVLGHAIQTSGMFRVEEYRPPKFLVDVSLPQQAYLAGEVLRAQVLARYLFGGAMAQAKVHWSAARRALAWRPPGNEGFSFGLERTRWDEDEEEHGEFSEVFGGGDGQVDAGGGFVTEVGRAETPGSRTWEYTVEAEVTDVDRQRVANRATVVVHPAAVHGGVRLARQGFAEVGQAVKVEAIAVDAAGERQIGAELALELRRREWKSIRQKSPGGEWTTTS